MKRNLSWLAALLVTAAVARAEDSASESFVKALEKETTDRDVAGALEDYKAIVEKHHAEEEVAAKAQYRAGECLEKLKRWDEAKKAFEAVVRDYPGQTAQVEKARARLAAKGAQPAAKTDPLKAMEEVLATRKIDLDFNESPLTDVLDFIREFARVEIMLDPAAGEAAAKPLTFKIVNLPIKDVLKLLATSTGLELANVNGRLVYTTAERKDSMEDLMTVKIDANASPEDNALLDKLKSVRISLNFTGTPISEVKSFLSDVTNISFVVAQGGGDPGVTVRITDAPLVEALGIIQLSANVRFTIENGAVVIRAGGK